MCAAFNFRNETSYDDEKEEPVDGTKTNAST
jgi:hypothetical protein